MGEVLNEYSDLILKIAYYHAQKYRNKRDDIISIVWLSAVELCHEVAAGKEGEFDKLISNKLNSACSYFLRNDNIFNIPDRTRRKNRLEQPKAIDKSVDNTDTIVNDVIAQDIMNTVAHTYREKLILEQRMIGYTIREIAETLSIPASLVLYDLRRIQKHYKDLK